MRYARSAVVAALVTLGLGATTGGLAAQVPTAQQQAQQQQFQRMQEQALRLTESLERMTRIQERAHEMEQLMLRDIERLRLQETLRQQDQERLQTQEHIRVMAHAMSGAAGDMTQAILGLKEMTQERTQLFDRDMEQQVERLRQHLEETCEQMEAGLRVMENLRERLKES